MLGLSSASEFHVYSYQNSTRELIGGNLPQNLPLSPEMKELRTWRFPNFSQTGKLANINSCRKMNFETIHLVVFSDNILACMLTGWRSYTRHDPL